MSELSVRRLFYVIFVVCLQQASANNYNILPRPAKETLTKLSLFEDALDYYNEVKRVIPIVRRYDKPCADSLEHTVISLGNGSLWAIQMVDASSKLPSGLLQGNLVDLGSFDECISVVASGVPPPFKGQHCLIDMSINFQAPPTFLPPGVLQTLGNSIPYTLSLCLPSTCSPKTIRAALGKMSDDINNLLGGKLTLKVGVKDSDCHTQDQSGLSTMEIVGIAVTSGILALAVISTIIDLTLAYQDRRVGGSRRLPEGLKHLVAFSFYSNGQRLLDTEPAAGTIQALHGLKFLSIAWVLVGHRVKLSAVEAPLANLLSLADVLKEWSSMIVLNATLSVDVFFVISGILNTYLYMSARQRTPLSHFRIYVHRYVRLTPAYAVMILVTGTWLYRIGSGPLWDRLVGDAKNSCTNYWWTGLLYINNYYNPNENCMMQSWYLAVDMQLFWLSPLVLYPLKRWPSVGLPLIVALIIPSIVIPFMVAYINLIKTPIPISLDTEKVNREMAKLYLPTHTKTIAYVIGMLTGYFLYLVKEDKIKFKHGPVRCLALWAIAVLAMGWALFGGHSLFQLDQPYDRWHSSLYIAFYRLAWSVGLAWIVFATTTGHGGVVTWLLSWRAFVPLGRLTYCIYLTHVAVILYGVGSLRQPQYFSYYDMFIKFLGELVIATLLAALLSLTVEAPIMRLEKIYFINGRPDRLISFRESRQPLSSSRELTLTGTSMEM